MRFPYEHHDFYSLYLIVLVTRFRDSAWLEKRGNDFCLSFAASEIAVDEIAAKNQPPTQRAQNLNRRLAFRRASRYAAS